MCGIAGFWNTQGPILRDPAASAERMAEAMRLRGPDDKGVWLSDDRRLALSHRRLSILDVSSRGHQPMLSPDGRSVIVYNGEIYNFRGNPFLPGEGGRPIRHGNGHGGHPGRLPAIRNRLSESLQRDVRLCYLGFEHRSLFLARDRFGVKPLLYYWHNGLFLFASEIKGVKSYDGPMKLTLNVPAIHRYFYLTYRISPDTVYNEVLQLDSGHYLLLKDGDIRCERWYDLAPRFHDKLHSIPEAESAFAGHLGERGKGSPRVRRPLGRLS